MDLFTSILINFLAVVVTILIALGLWVVVNSIKEIRRVKKASDKLDEDVKEALRDLIVKKEDE